MVSLAQILAASDGSDNIQVKSTRYKQGSIERRGNAKGSVWRLRYKDNAGIAKVLTFDTKLYPTQADVLKATKMLRHEINKGTAYSYVKRLTARWL